MGSCCEPWTLFVLGGFRSDPLIGTLEAYREDHRDYPGI